MKSTSKRILVVLIILLSSTTYAQNTVTTDDLKSILGAWTGSLTYTDYSTNNPFTMPANLIVSQGKNEFQVLLKINYPKEPNANSKDKIRISKDGSQLNKIDVISREILPNGQTQIITQYTGKDNGKKALINMIYILGTSDLVIRKEVKFEDAEVWLIRNEYKYSR